MNDKYSNKSNWEYDEQSYNALKYNYFKTDDVEVGLTCCQIL